MRTLFFRIAGYSSVLGAAFPNQWFYGEGQRQASWAWEQDSSQQRTEAQTGPLRLTSVHIDKVRGGDGAGWGRGQNRQEMPALCPL